MKKTTNKKDKNWLRNPKQRKNPKLFTAKFVQMPDGSFRILGNETKVLSRKNQYSGEWVNVDTRDFAREVRMNGIHSL